MKKLFTIVLSGILAACAAIGLSACSFNTYTSPDKDKYTAGNAVITDKVEALDIEWAAGKVIFVTGSAGEVRIEEDYKGTITEDKKMYWYLDGTTLRVRYDMSLDIISFGGSGSKTLTVTLPSDLVLKDAKISVASADITADALRCKSVNIDSASGDVDVTLPGNIDSADFDTASGDVNVKFGGDVGKLDYDASSGDLMADIAGNLGSFDADAASGAVVINAAGTAGPGKVSTSSGKVDISCDGLDDIDIDTASGSVTLRLTENADIRIDFDTASGKFNSEIPVIMDGNSYVIGSGKSTVNVDTASGNFDILKR